jgi:hypothetical protein
MPERRAVRGDELEMLILRSIQELEDKHKREILDFIEFLKIREDRSFIEYVNRRTEEAMDARKRGDQFTSLQELQQEYA